MRFGRILFAVVATLLVVGVVAGIGFTAYNAGVSQGLIDSGKLVVPAPGAIVPADGTTAPMMMPFGYYQRFGYGGFGGFHRPFGFGFGILGCLFPLLFVLFLFGLFRFAFRPRWGRGWGGPGMGMRGVPQPGSGQGWGDPSQGDVPPGVKEWHRKMHEEEQAPTPPPAPTTPA